MELIDLHTHSTASDGTLSPSELVCKAAKSNISVLALTDHDSVSGCSEANEKCRTLGIKFIPGVEISAAEHKKLHILGLGIDYSCDALKNRLDMLKNERNLYTGRICDILNQKGYSISFEEVSEEAGNSSMGKPHIARVLMKHEIVGSIEDAFKKIFSIPEISNLKKVKLSAHDAVSLIHEAGGKAFIAHPYQMKKSHDELHMMIKELKKSGIDGIECWYSKYTPEMMEEYLGFSKEFDLLQSIGSDFHGENKPDICLGTGLDNSIVKLRKIKDIDENMLKALLT